MELRLFPLQTVLFPGMQIPLNVFEPRYLQLVNECSELNEPFGIMLIREGPEVGGPSVPFDIGTTARIEQASPGILNAIQLIARGEQRVRILELHRDRPYLWADVEVIDDEPGTAPPELIKHGQELLDQFEQLRYSTQGDYIQSRSQHLPKPPGVIADAIGATGAGSAAERQELLETLDPSARLEQAVEIIAPLLEEIKQRIAQGTVQRWMQPGALN